MRLHVCVAGAGTFECGGEAASRLERCGGRLQDDALVVDTKVPPSKPPPEPWLDAFQTSATDAAHAMQRELLTYSKQTTDNLVVLFARQLRCVLEPIGI